MADNQKLYIHEFIDIVGHHRADYMYHMTANFSPMGQEDRNQLCYGVWGILGSTGRWPEVVNMWELDGFDGAVDYFRFEVSGKTMQDPRMARWWAAAVPMRSGGNDRLLVPAPWTRSSTELCGAGVGGELYAHDRIGVRPGSAPEFLEMVREEAVSVYSRLGWTLAGAWTTAMCDESECFLLWVIEDWEHWAELERAHRTDDALIRWNTSAREVTRSMERILLIDAPLSPFRTKRQPRRSDRTVPWDEG
jgi:hypothetical protein